MFEQDQSVVDETHIDDAARAEALLLLHEALAIIDTIRRPIAAIHVCWAIDLLAEEDERRRPATR